MEHSISIEKLEDKYNIKFYIICNIFDNMIIQKAKNKSK